MSDITASVSVPSPKTSLRGPVLWRVVIGLLQAATPLVFWWLEDATVYALGLVAIAFIYIGFAVADGRPKVIAVESSVTFAFVLVAAAAVTRSPWLLVAGLAGHGLKDLWQHRTHFVSGTRWWPPFCMVVEVRQDHRVAVAVGHEDGHADRADPLQLAVIRNAPFAHRVVLRLPGLPGRLLVSVVASRGQPRQGLHARLPARGRAREEHAEVTVGVAVGLADRSDHVGRPAVHPGGAARGRRREDHATDRRRPDQCDLLGDEAADREAQEVDRAELEGLE
jgi:hypothetical protein